MNCEWVTDPSGIVIQGYKIKRGFFYLGEAFPVYNRRRLLGNIGRKTNVQFLKEPVIDSTLPISETKTKKVIVSSYTTMEPYQRFQYLKWLSGEQQLNETPVPIIMFHLWGISVRIFCDDECQKKEVASLTKYLKELRTECGKYDWKSKSIIKKIDELLSYVCLKYYPKRMTEYKEFEYIRQNSVMEKIALLSSCTLNDAYDIWLECFPRDKSIEKYSDAKKKEWWTIAYEIVKEQKSQKALFPRTLKFDFSDWGKEMGFRPNRIPLDTVITHYSKDGIEFCSLIYRCHNEFYKCYRRHRAGYAVYKSSEGVIVSKKKTKTDPNNINLNNGKSPIALKDAVISPTQKYAKGIKKNLTSDYQVISVSKILEEVECNSTNPLIITTKLKVVYQSFFDEGIGMVPSHTYLNRYFKPEDKLIIFQRLPGELYEPDYLYDFVDVFLKLAAYISQGSVTDRERSFVQSFIANKDKRVGNQKQLYAYFLWYLKTIRSINTEIRQCINNDLNAKGRENIAKHLVEYVESDFDTLFTKELLLVNVLPILSSKPFKISEVKRNEALVTIDQNKLSKIKQDTHVAQSFLSDIFDDNEQEVIVKTQGFEHEEILAEILSKDSWERDELSNLCKQKGYILGSLLEEINDYSYSKVDDAIIEDDGDVLYINVEYKKDLL